MPDVVKNYKIDRNTPDDICPDDNLLTRWYEGYLTKEDSLLVQNHLNSCKICFEQIATLIEMNSIQVTKEEEREIEKQIKMTSQEQVSKIIQYNKQLNPVTQEKVDWWKKLVILSVLVKSVKVFLHKNRNYGKYYWKAMIAFSVLFIFIIGIRPTVRYYNTDYQVSRAKKILLKNHRIHIEDARLSGGYSSTGISMLMAPDQEKPDYIERTKAKLKKVVNKDAESLKANCLLAQVFVMEKLNSKADSVFLAIGDTVYSSAPLLNDRGVLYFQQRYWKKAALHFQSALEIDKNFLEAYYNLALVKRKLGELDEAISILNKYIELEHDKGWRDAAHRLMNIINREI